MGGASPQQINTRARGHSSQSYDVNTSKTVNLTPGRPPRLAPERATSLEQDQPPRLVPVHAADICSKKNEVEVNDEMIENMNMNISKSENDRPGMIDIGQSEVRSPKNCVRMKSSENGPSGLTDLKGDSLSTNSKKSGFKHTPTSNLNCQAQPKPQFNWAELALFSLNPTTHPPTHPPGKVSIWVW
mgnify:CR=1 FL=1